MPVQRTASPRFFRQNLRHGAFMKTWSFILAATLAASSTWVAAQPAPGGTCQAKRESIHRDLDEAKAKGQKHIGGVFNGRKKRSLRESVT
jgi:hypothetical protein